MSDASDALKLGYDAAQGTSRPGCALPLAARLPRVVAPGTALGVLAPEVGARWTSRRACASSPAAPTARRPRLGRGGARRRQHDARHDAGVQAPGRPARRAPAALLPRAARRALAARRGESRRRRLDRARFRRRGPAPRRGCGGAAAERAPRLACARAGRALPAARRARADAGRGAARRALARYAAGLQGVAFVERLGYEVLDAATLALRAATYATGGGAASDLWCRLRADVTGRALHRPACGETALGAAVLAALGAGLHPDLATACGALVRPGSTFRPDPGRARAFAPHYARFRAALAAHGLLDDRPA
ncbi:MAG: hypothetical protein H6828_11765 [Planctomycetes bacterium]|nr:hypothetical protein [Planctomycetota bacterium]